MCSAAGPTVEVHLNERELKGGEVLLLCSDGIHGVLSADDLQGLLQNTPDRRGRGRQRSSSKALDAGSRDNVTALVVAYEADK